MNRENLTDVEETQATVVENEEMAQALSMTEPGLANDSPVDVSANALAKRQRNDGITLIAGYHFFWGALLLLATCVLAIPTIITGIVGFAEDPDALIATGILFVIGSIVMVLCLLYLIVGYGLWTLRSWGRTAAIALGVISLLNVPIGTFLGGATIWYLLKEDVAQQFR